MSARHVQLLAASLWLTGGCLLVVSDDDAPKCAIVDEVDPCPSGTQCIGGVCIGCVASEELCDGSDNDCDTTIDEGHDNDEDGATWCGGGRQEEQDCDDNDATVYPSLEDAPPATETCDGKDNDCDGVIDEAPAQGSICPTNQVCISTEGCIVPDCTTPGYECEEDQQCDLSIDPPDCRPGRCTDATCLPGTICDEQTGSCIESLPIGASCSVDAECESQNCIAMAALRLTEDPTSRICGRACCSDADCAPDTICWASGSGARSCIPPSLINTERGELPALAECSDGSQCQSGLCAGACVGNCARDSNCGSSGVCALFGPVSSMLFDDWVLLACQIPQGVGDIGDFCLDAADCDSRLCLGFGAGECSRACGTGTDCPGTYYCGVAGRVTSEERRADFVPACIAKNHSGQGTTGDACASANDCRDFRCEDQRCADACCNDADCEATSTICQPVVAGERWEMHCL